MPGEGLILTESLLHVTNTEIIIHLDVSGTDSEDDPQVDERLYASGHSRGVVGFRDTRPFVVNITEMTPDQLRLLQSLTGKTAVYRPDADMGVDEVIIGKVRFNQMPQRLGGNFNVRLTLHRQTDRSA